MPSDDESAERFESVVAKAGSPNRYNEVFTEEALRSQDGKVVPLKDRPGGVTIGEATLSYDEGQQALKAMFTVRDKIVAEFLKGNPPNLFS